MERVIVWFSIQNGGDGSAYPAWFLTEVEAESDQESMDEGWAENCIGAVETYVGSNVWHSATNRSNN